MNFTPCHGQKELMPDPFPLVHAGWLWTMPGLGPWATDSPSWSKPQDGLDCATRENRWRWWGRKANLSG